MITLPPNFIPQTITLDSLPSLTIGSITEASTALYNPTIRLSGDKLPVQLTLQFRSLPYYGYQDVNYKGQLTPSVAEACGVDVAGWDDIWQFFDKVQSGVVPFTIPPDHVMWQRLGIGLYDVILPTTPLRWRVVSIKEFGDLRDVRSLDLTIVSRDVSGKTLLPLNGIPRASGDVLNPMLAGSGELPSPINPLPVDPALGEVATAAYIPEQAQDELVVSIIPKVPSVVSESPTEYGISEVTPVTTAVINQPEYIDVYVTSAGYQYFYGQAQWFDVAN